MARMAGTLFVVATPIGNLEDLSFRALRTLKEVDLIAAEDTRRTSKLLAHYNVRKTLVSLHEHNEHRETTRLITRLESGQSVALVSDAGTPGISDPGQLLVRAAHQHGIRVSPIPGANSIAAALSTTGLPADQFVFLGYPPRSGKARSDWIEELKSSPRTCVFFEAPHRITRTLAELAGLLVKRQIFIHREISKLHEELVIYNNETSDVVAETGEFVVVVQGISVKDKYLDGLDSRLKTGLDVLDCLTNNRCFSQEVAADLASSAAGVNQDDLRKASKLRRIAANRSKDPVS